MLTKHGAEVWCPVWLKNVVSKKCCLLLIINFDFTQQMNSSANSSGHNSMSDHVLYIRPRQSHSRPTNSNGYFYNSSVVIFLNPKILLIHSQMS